MIPFDKELVGDISVAGKCCAAPVKIQLGNGIVDKLQQGSECDLSQAALSGGVDFIHHHLRQLFRVALGKDAGMVERLLHQVLVNSGSCC